MSGFVVMETTPAGHAYGHLHQPIPEKVWDLNNGGALSILRLEQAVAKGTYRWPTRCGRDGVVFVKCKLFRDVEPCLECAA